jgi:hypothetical protein
MLKQSLTLNLSSLYYKHKVWELEGKKRDHLWDGKTILKWIVENYDTVIWCGFT